MVFRIASSPYTHNQRQTSRIMMLVCLAALPGNLPVLFISGDADPIGTQGKGVNTVAQPRPRFFEA